MLGITQYDCWFGRFNIADSAVIACLHPAAGGSRPARGTDFTFLRYVCRRLRNPLRGSRAYRGDHHWTLPCLCRL